MRHYFLRGTILGYSFGILPPPSPSPPFQGVARFRAGIRWTGVLLESRLRFVSVSKIIESGLVVGAFALV